MSYNQVPKIPFLMELDPTHRVKSYANEYLEYMDQTEDELQWPVYEEAKGG